MSEASEALDHAAFKQLVWALAPGEPEDYETIVDGVQAAIEEHRELQERVDDLEQRLEMIGDIGTEKTNKEQKVAAIVTYASQKDSGMKGTVVKPKEIAGVANVSERYAYDLIDDIVNGDGEDGSLHDDGYPWALDAAAQTSVDKDAPGRGLIVDFDRLHEDTEALNKFINGTAAEGGR
ncbi:hypothetical protein [Halorubrum sp. HHNYT27]|uniref:hypothetical protein n=1 Tax=Halorubrum sp. HHNYT27 TaxID=3402275 RepID=UPI003EBBC2E5